MTLKNLWDSLDKNRQDDLFYKISASLMVSPETTISYIRGRRAIPERKRPCLTALIEGNFHITITY